MAAPCQPRVDHVTRQWNGADAADAAGRVRLGTQADRDGLDLFTVADHPYFGAASA
jgi:hypothetical protein